MTSNLEPLIDTGRIAPWCKRPACRRSRHRLNTPHVPARPPQHAKPMRLTRRGERAAACLAGLVVLLALCAPTLERML